VNISATISNARGTHSASVRTEGEERVVAIPPKLEGMGSSVNGGELLFLALATCYCTTAVARPKSAE
jgi:organic hydroperoxide reductase OsmC/OhrA